MNKRTKIALIGLTVLVLLFAGTVGLGFRKGNDKNGDPDETPPKWTEWLGKVLPSPIPRVALAKMQLNRKPLKNNRLTLSQTVTITFSESDEKYRKVDVKWISGAPIKLTYKDESPPETNGKTPKDPTIGPADDMENRIIVSHEGGSLTLTPLGRSITVIEFTETK